MATASASLLILAAASCAVTLATNTPIDFGGNYFPDSEFVDLMARDSEPLIPPASFGHKYMSGGAGEGEQRLAPDDDFESRQQVKSDNLLPNYCEPPNPCPVGQTTDDGCLEEFENTAEFSRNYQSQQQCLCDQEHMFNCPTKEKTDDEGDDLDTMLAANGLHKSVMSKKFHEKRSDFEIPRRKRSSGFGAASHPNPYLSGEPLHSVSKKDGRHIY